MASLALKRRCSSLAVVAFDLLHLDGRDLRRLPLVERRRLLASLVARSSIPCLVMSEAYDDGVALLLACAAAGLEGVVSKRRDGTYRSGKTAGW